MHACGGQVMAGFAEHAEFPTATTYVPHPRPALQQIEVSVGLCAVTDASCDCDVKRAAYKVQSTPNSKTTESQPFTFSATSNRFRSRLPDAQRLVAVINSLTEISHPSKSSSASVRSISAKDYHGRNCSSRYTRSGPSIAFRSEAVKHTPARDLAYIRSFSWRSRGA